MSNEPVHWTATSEMFVIEDDDPRIEYSGSWSHFRGRPEIYTSASYHNTYELDASAKFTFEGTHVWVVGDYNADHGAFKVIVNGAETESTTYWDSHIPFATMFECALEGPGPHTVELINTSAGQGFGLDAIAYLPLPGAEPLPPRPPPADPPSPWILPERVLMIGDSDPRIQYSFGWSHSQGNPEIYSGGSYHLTYEEGASATFTFESGHLWVISDVNEDHGAFTVTVDNNQPIKLTTYWSEYLPNRIIYERRFPYPGRHTIVLRNAEGGKGLGLDAFAYIPLDAPLRSPTSPYAPSLYASVKGREGPKHT